MPDITIELPYEPKVSVNAAHYQGRQSMTYVPEAQAWLLLLKNTLIRMTSSDMVPAVGTVTAEIRVYQPEGRGRTADSQNFVKHPVDTIASVLEVDDHNFRITTHPTVRGDLSKIQIRIEWEHK